MVPAARAFGDQFFTAVCAARFCTRRAVFHVAVFHSETRERSLCVEEPDEYKSFYIPSRREMEEFYDKGCLLSSQSHQAMHRFLMNRLDVKPDLAEIQGSVFYDIINNEVRMQETVDSL